MSASTYSPRFRNPGSFSQEQRSEARRSVIDLQLIAVDFGPENGGIVLDICDHGIGIQAVTGADTGTATGLNFILPGTQSRIDATAEVVWSDGAGRLGMRFCALEKDSKNKIHQWCGQKGVPEVGDDVRNGLATPSDATLIVPFNIPEAGHKVASEAGQTELVDLSAPRKQRPSEAEVNGELLRIAATAMIETSADGAAIALRDHDEMVGIASAGTAPDVGARFRSNSGLSGECVRTGRVVQCQDTDRDARVNPKVCRELNLRSLVIAPIRIAEETVGVLEVLSSRTWAFEESDVSKLSEMAASISSIMLRNRKPLPEFHRGQSLTRDNALASVAKSSHQGEAEIRPRVVDSFQEDFERNSPLPIVIADAPQSRVSKSKSLIPIGVLWLLMGFLFYVLSSQQTYLLKSSPAGPVSSADIPAADTRTGDDKRNSVPSNIESNKTIKGAMRDRRTRPAIKLGLKNQQQTEVVRSAVSESGAAGTNPSNNAFTTVSNGIQTTPSKLSDIAPEASGLSGGVPIVKVAPVYPSSMLVNSAERELVLKAIINGDGSVKDAELVSGPEALALPAIEAVKKWRYEPFTLNGKPTEAQTFITIKIAPRK